jgi:IclR family KDG regulon transcriptional repressor
MRTLKRAFLILESLAGAAKKLSLMEITEKTRIDKATCLRFLSSLEEIGVVQRDEKTRLYELGLKALFLGNGFLKTLRIEEKVRRYLERLVLETEETAFYSIRRRDSRVTLYLQESPHETRTLVDLGISIPLTSGCASRAILAFLPEDEIHSILRREAIAPSTAWSITDSSQVLKKITEIRTRGYAVGIRERAPTTNAVAAPVFNNEGVAASLVIVGPAERLTKKVCEKFGPVVRDLAQKLSEEMGSQPFARPHTGQLEEVAIRELLLPAS